MAAAGRHTAPVSATAVRVMTGGVVSVVVIGPFPDRAAGTSGLTTTTNGLRRIDIVDEGFLGDPPASSRCGTIRRCSYPSEEEPAGVPPIWNAAVPLARCVVTPPR